MQLTATQTLTVTGDETVVAQDETVTCTAEVMLRVTLWLLDTGAVEADGSIVSFDLDADPLSAANAEIVTVGGVVIPGGASLSEVEVEGGVVAFEVALATNPGALDEAPTGIVVPIEGAKIKYRIVEEDAGFTWGTTPVRRDCRARDRDDHGWRCHAGDRWF